MATIEIPDNLYHQLTRQVANNGSSIEAWLADTLATNPPKVDTPFESRLIGKIPDLAPYMLYVFDRRLGHNTFVNRFTEDFFGLTLPEMQAQGVQLLADRLHPDDHEMLAAFINQWDDAPEGVLYEGVYRLRHADGSYRWIHTYETVLTRSEDDDPIEILGAAFDITEQKTTEQELQLREARYRAASNSSLHAFYLMESVRDSSGEIVDFRLVEINDTAVAQLGMSRDQLIGNLICEMFPVNRTNGFFDQYRQVAETGEPLMQDYSIPSEFTAPGWYHHEVVKVGDGVAIINQDITEQKRIETELANSRETLTQLIQQIPVGLQVFNADGLCTDVNDAHVEIFGVSRENLVNQYNIFDDPLAQGMPTGQAARRALNGETVRLGDIDFDFAQADPHFADQNKERYYINVTLVPIFDGDGGVSSFVGVNVDVTGRRTREQQLRTSEERLRSMLETQSAFVTRIDLEGNYLYANPSFKEYYEWMYPDGDLIGQSSMESVAPVDHDQVNAVVERCRHNPGQPFQVMMRKPKKDGDVFWSLWEFVALQDENGEVVEYQCIGFDISDRVRTENALRESEARYRTIAEHFPNGLLALYDHDLRYTVVNGQGLADAGLTSADLEGKRLRDVFPPDVYKRDEPALLAALKGETTVSTVEYANGFFRVMTVPVEDDDGTIIGGMVMSQNITELKQAEAAQQDLIHQLELAVDTAQLGVWQLDIVTGKLEWNERLHEIYGITPEEFVENVDGWREMVHPDDKAYADERFAEISTKGAVKDVKYRIQRKDGEVRYIDASGAALYNENREIVRLIGINVDVTEAERSKQALEASERRYRTLFNAALNPIVVYDENGRIVMINEVGARGLGLSPEEAIGKTLDDFYPGFHEITKERVRHVLDSGTTLYVEDEITIPGAGKHWFWTAIQPLETKVDGVGQAQFMTYDITEGKQAEQLELERARLSMQLEQEHQLAELRSKLLSIISHEFRTPMTIMMSSSELLTKYHERLSPEGRQQRIDNIAEQIRHLNHLLDDVSKLSRTNRGFMDFKPGVANVSAMCAKVLREMEDMASDNHTLRLETNAPDETAVLDEKLMRHALTNLLSNAIKYSPEGGEILLRITQANGDWHFAVSDQGLGIPEQDQAGMFQPFNRAGNVGKIRGTGLGLAITREIAEQHGGTVQFVSQVGQGSTFTLMIPTDIEVST